MQTKFEHAVLLLQSRRRQLRSRAVAGLGSAALILLACWGAGVFEQWRSWFAPKTELPITARTAPVTPQQPAPQQATHTSGLADDGAVGKLRLIATRPGRNAHEGAAQLATGPAGPLTYIAGALLANGASLLEIHADHVVLKRDALTTELYVDGTTRSGRGAKPLVREDLITVSAPAQHAPKAVGPETYTSLVRTAPRFVDGKIAGFEVYGGALSTLNLRSGDVLLEIDGRVLTSVEQLHSSLRAIRDGASATATVERGAEQVVVAMDGALLKVQPQPAMAELPQS